MITPRRTIRLDDAVWDWTKEYAASKGHTATEVILGLLCDLHDDVEARKRAV